MDNIVLAIKEIQVKKRLYDTEIAESIGIAVTSWRRIKSGKFRYGRKFLDGAQKAFPDIFLPLNVTNQ